MARHAVLGAGGVGGLVAAQLAHNGADVEVIVRNPSHPAEITVESAVLGSFTAAVRPVQALTSEVDFLWVTVKATQLDAAIASAPPRLVRKSAVTLLNGIDHVARLREVYAHVTAGALGGETERIEPGHIVQPSGFLWIHLTGEHALDACHDLGSICSVKEDERLVLWQKLAILAPFALSTTAVQQPLGAIRGDPAQWARLLAAIDEVAAVAHAQGIPVVADAAKNGLANAGPEFRSSMQKDRAAGRPLELDHIVEPILREGRRHGVPTPVVEGLAGQIRALAQG